MAHFDIHWNLIPGIQDAPHAHEPHAAASHHLPEAPVLPGSEVPHPALVVRILVHEPVAIHHVARHAAAGPVVTIHDGVAVVRHVHHLAHEVLPLVHPHPVGTSVLIWRRNKGTITHPNLECVC